MVLDGFNYYQLLNMLSSGGEVKALAVARKHEIKREGNLAMGEKESAFAMGGAVLCNVLCGLLMAATCGKKPAVGTYYLDAAKVAAAKEAAVAGRAGVEYVSTNDLLLSRFGQVSTS